MGFGDQSLGDSGPAESVTIIDLVETQQEAPFAIRDAGDGQLGSKSDVDLWGWLGDHPVAVGIATGIVCFAIIATAVSMTAGSGTMTSDDPVAGSADSGTDGSRGSFSGDSLNFTSDDPKRTGNMGAPKAQIEAEKAETGIASPTPKTVPPASPAADDQTLDATGVTGDGPGGINEDMALGNLTTTTNTTVVGPPTTPPMLDSPITRLSTSTTDLGTTTTPTTTPTTSPTTTTTRPSTSTSTSAPSATTTTEATTSSTSSTTSTTEPTTSSSTTTTSEPPPSSSTTSSTSTSSTSSTTSSTTSTTDPDSSSSSTSSSTSSTSSSSTSTTDPSTTSSTSSSSTSSSSSSSTTSTTDPDPSSSSSSSTSSSSTTSSTTSTTDPNSSSSSTTDGSTSSSTSSSTTPGSSSSSTSSSVPSDPPPDPPPPAPEDNLIAAPADGSEHPIDETIDFAAIAVPGAVEYCWRFVQDGESSDRFCSTGTFHQLDPASVSLDAGVVDVHATAEGPSVQRSGTISIVLTADTFFAQPTDGATVTMGRTFPVRIAEIAGATDYQLRFTQDGYDSDWQSYGTTNGTTIMADGDFWDAVAPGPLTVEGRVLIGTEVVASGTVVVTLVADTDSLGIFGG